jgi:hypothetical protein
MRLAMRGTHVRRIFGRGDEARLRSPVGRQGLLIATELACRSSWDPNTPYVNGFVHRHAEIALSSI